MMVHKQLMAHKQPFLILGGELHHSSASRLDYRNTLRRRAAGLNTVYAIDQGSRILSGGPR